MRILHIQGFTELNIKHFNENETLITAGERKETILTTRTTRSIFSAYYIKIIFFYNLPCTTYIVVCNTTSGYIDHRLEGKLSWASWSPLSISISRTSIRFFLSIYHRFFILLLYMTLNMSHTIISGHHRRFKNGY